MAEATIGHLIEEVRETSAQEQDKTQGVKNSVDNLVNQFAAFFQNEKAKKLDEAEAKREEKKEVGDTTVFQDVGDAFRSIKGLGFVGMIGAIVGGLSGLVKGAATGFLDAAKVILKSFGGIFKLFTQGLTAGFSKLFPNTAKQISNLAKGVTTAFSQGLKGINGGIRGVNGAFRKLNFADRIAKSVGGMVRSVNTFGADVGARLTSIGSSVSNASKAFAKGAVTQAKGMASFYGGIVKNVGTSITGFLRNLGFTNFFDEIAKSAKSGGNTIKTFAQGVIKQIQTTFNGIKTAFSTGFTKFFGAFARLGRFIFFPITIIVSLIDAIKGFKEGFAASGNSMIGGVLGAISGVLKGLIGLPLDLLKGIVGWVAGKFGMDGVQEFLASFSFADIIGNLFNTITDTVLGFFDAMNDEAGNFNYGKMVVTVVQTLFNTATAPLRMIMDGLAALADKIGFDGTAERIRRLSSGMKLDFTGQEEATQTRTANREQFEATQAEQERLARLEETPRDQSTQTLQETTTTQNNPVVINQVDASTKDMSVRTSASTSVIGDPTPAMDLSFGNRVAYV